MYNYYLHNFLPNAVTLLATTDSLNMMGFFIQGRVSQQDTKIVGSFLPLADSEPAHLMDCVGGRNVRLLF